MQTQGEYLREVYADHDMVVLVVNELAKEPIDGVFEPEATVPARATVEGCERVWDLLPRTHLQILTSVGGTREATGAALLQHFRKAPAPDGLPIVVLLTLSGPTIDLITGYEGEEPIVTELFAPDFVVVLVEREERRSLLVQLPRDRRPVVWEILPEELQQRFGANGWTAETFDGCVLSWYAARRELPLSPDAVPVLELDSARQARPATPDEARAWALAP